MTFAWLFYAWFMLLAVIVNILYFRPLIQRTYALYKFKRAYAKKWKEQGGRPRRKAPHTCNKDALLSVNMPNGDWYYRCYHCGETLTTRNYDALDVVRIRG